MMLNRVARALAGILFGAAIVFAGNVSTTLAQGEGTSITYPTATDEDNVAIRGYDPVSFFVSDTAKKGSEEFAVTYNDAIYHFASEANQQRFMSNPAKYAPRFGGFCPVNLAEGQVVKGDPSHYQIVDGRLYLCNSSQASKSFKASTTDVIGGATEQAPAALATHSTRGR